MTTELADLTEAVNLIRQRATESTDVPDERWMVDQSPDHGLVVGAYSPEDIAEDGSISTGCVAYLAYPGDEENRAHGRALPTASHMAGLDPAVALELAGWLDGLRLDLASTDGNLDSCDAPNEIRSAVRLARVYLRKAVQ